MVFRDLFADTLRTLWTHKLRTFLTMFGIAWGIISITLMIAAAEGLRVGQRRQQQNFGKDIMIVFAGRTSLQAGGMRSGRRVIWLDRDVEAVREEATACRYVLPELGNNASVRSQARTRHPRIAAPPGRSPALRVRRAARLPAERAIHINRNTIGGNCVYTIERVISLP